MIIKLELSPAAFLPHLLRTVPGRETHREFRYHISLLGGERGMLKKMIPPTSKYREKIP